MEDQSGGLSFYGGAYSSEGVGKLGEELFKLRSRPPKHSAREKSMVAVSEGFFLLTRWPTLP